MVYFGFYLFLRYFSCILDQFCAVNKFALSIYCPRLYLCLFPTGLTGLLWLWMRPTR